MTTQTLETVLRTFRHYKLLSSNQTLIVGVSGGIDSLALLHILIQIQHQLQIRLHVATLNHGIRGESAVEDVQFVQQMAEEWHIPYTLGNADVPQLAKDEQIGIEAAARKARYAFLAQVAQEQNTDVVAVAHHANDQAETILMHIVRGSGLNGLRGMSPSASMPEHSEITLIRPLLNVTRVELEQYCITNNLQPRHDETNDDTDYQRNFIRLEILPRLESINPSVVSALLRLSENATIDEDYLSEQFETIMLPQVIMSKGRWKIDTSTLVTAPPTFQRRYILKAFQALSGSSEQLSSDQITNVLRWIKSAQVATSLDLGQGIRCRIGYEMCYIEESSKALSYDDYILLPEDTNILISGMQNNDIPYIKIIEETFGLRIGIHEISRHSGTINKIVELSKNSELRLRTRLNGDRFRPKGMNGHSRKLKNWMIDRKIPKQIRDRIPLIVADEQIIAICVEKTWHLAEISQDYLNEKSHVYLILGGLET